MNRKIVLLLVIIVAGYLGSKLFGGDEKPHENEKSGALTVSVEHPSEKTIKQRISATGMLVPHEEVAVLTELTNVRIKQLLVDVGDSVKKGQKIAVLDGESLELQSRQLEADYKKASDEYARIEPIKDSGAVSKISVIEKRSIMEAAKARMEDAKLALRRTTITAPEPGVIYERRATLGGIVNANEPLFRIAQGNEVEAQLRVPEAEIGEVRVGQLVTLSITGSKQKWKGKVRLIAPQIDAANRTAQVRVSIAEKVNLIVGSFVRADIMTGDKKGLMLPATAILEDSKGSFVWLVDEKNKAVRQPVKLSVRQDNVTLVEGVDPSMRIITKAGSFVKAGEVINPVEKK